MICLKCRKESTDHKRCTSCGASMVAATARWGNPVADESTSEAATAHSAPVRPWWLTTKTVVGSLLILVSVISMMLLSDYAPPKNLDEGMTRAMMTGQDKFIRPGVYQVILLFEWSAIIVGGIFWGMAIKRKFFSEIREITKAAASTIQAASSKINDAVSRSAPTKDDPMATIKRLKELVDQGVISEAEFAQKKAELMSKI